MRRVVGELEQGRNGRTLEEGTRIRATAPAPPSNRRSGRRKGAAGTPCGELDGWKRTGADDDGDLAKHHGRSLVDCSATSAAFALRRAGGGAAVHQ